MTGCRDVGPGDFVKVREVWVGEVWKEIEFNSAYDQQYLPTEWTVTTTDGSSYDMYGIRAYATVEEVRSWGI